MHRIELKEGADEWFLLGILLVLGAATILYFLLH
jgi:hypothetical protein